MDWEKIAKGLIIVLIAIVLISIYTHKPYENKEVRDRNFQEFANQFCYSIWGDSDATIVRDTERPESEIPQYCDGRRGNQWVHYYIECNDNRFRYAIVTDYWGYEELRSDESRITQEYCDYEFGISAYDSGY